MKLLSTAGLVFVFVAWSLEATFVESFLLLPTALHRAASKRHLSEKLLNEINELDLTGASSLPLRRRSTNEDGQRQHALAAYPSETGPGAPVSALEHIDGVNLRKELPKIDPFGDLDWPPRPKRARICADRMYVAFSSALAVTGGIACPDENEPGTAWRFEGPLREKADFYLKKRPRAGVFTDPFERLVDLWLQKQEPVSAKARGTGALQTGRVRASAAPEHRN